MFDEKNLSCFLTRFDTLGQFNVSSSREALFWFIGCCRMQLHLKTSYNILITRCLFNGKRKSKRKFIEKDGKESRKKSHFEPEKFWHNAFRLECSSEASLHSSLKSLPLPIMTVAFEHLLSLLIIDWLFGILTIGLKLILLMEILMLQILLMEI